MAQRANLPGMHTVHDPQDCARCAETHRRHRHARATRFANRYGDPVAYLLITAAILVLMTFEWILR